ncbi:MAG: thiamine pyrophosphate-binding protein [Candidatus Nanopelagicales bacterium]
MNAGGETVAARILDLLAAAGVRHVFGLPGLHNLPFWSAEPTRRPRIVGVRHEQTAAYAADGLARASGGLGVAVVTSGPGLANTVAALGEARSSGSPVLMIASEPPLSARRPGRRLLHDLPGPQRDLVLAVTKQRFVPQFPDEAVQDVATALHAAMSWPRGPVYVGIAADLLAAPSTAAPRLDLLQRPEPRGVNQAASLLAQCERILLWVGGGAVQSGAGEHVDALARRLGSPVVATFAARGILGADHPLLIDLPPHEPVVRDVLAQADAMVAIGTAFEGMQTMNWSLELPPRLLRVGVRADMTAQEDYPPDWIVDGDAARACDALALHVGGREAWADAPYRMKRDVHARHRADPTTAVAAAMVDAVEQSWPDHGNVVCDMSVAGYWVAGYAAQPRPRRLQYPVGWGTLGFALPASVGAAAGGAPTLVVCGDGAAAMAVGELATLVQERLAVCVLVVDDGGYGMLRYDQERAGWPQHGVDLVGPDWVALATAYGLVSERIDDERGLTGALARAAVADGPTLLHMPLALTPPRTTSPRWADPA